MQRWQVSRSKNGRITASTSRFYGTDLPRLFGMFNDPDSWPMESPERLIRIVPDELLSFSFDNDTRVELTFERIRNGLFRVNLMHEQLHDEQELADCQAYWDEVLQDIFKRLLCEPVHAATAFGKINLFFKVGPLLDNGYHQVASLYQSVNLPETVVAELASDWEVQVTGTLEQAHLDAVPTNRNNLVVKAAKAAATVLRFRKTPRLAITIHKTVPVAGGMGGGSADAAAAILAAEAAWGRLLTEAERLEIGATLGADVPFSLMGGAAIGLGTGHELTPIPQRSLLHWVLVPNSFGLSTPAVYAELDRLRELRGENPKWVREASVNTALVRALKDGASAEDIAPLMHNDLEEAALSLRPELREIFDLGERAMALRVMVSGSGPTIALLARDAADAQAIASRMVTFGQQAVVTTSPAGPAQLVY
jgi:4-diphosphocytidyl-2-C-methyl-D-erythritol kinase